MNESGNTQRLKDWEPCDGGELRQVVWRLKSQRRNQDMLKAGGVVVVLLLCAFAATLVWQQASQQGEYDYGGITCKEVMNHLAAFKQGTLEDQQLANRLRVHLDECPHCGPLSRNASARATISRAALHSSTCSCIGCNPSAQESSNDVLFAVGPAK